MSLLDENFISIPLYYMVKAGKYDSKQVVVLADDTASKMLEEGSSSVQILNTKWKVLTWKEQNDLLKESERPAEAGEMPSFDWALFQERRLKKALRWWDLKQNDADPEPLAVSSDNVDKMPSHVIRALLDKYDAVANMDEEEEKN